MTLPELLRSLEEHDVQLKARGEQNLVLTGAVEDLPRELIDKVSDQKAAILGLLTAASAAAPNTPPSADGTVYLASHGQNRLAFLDKLEPHSTAYNVTASILVNGRCRTADLVQAITAVTAAHPASRTHLVRVNDVNLSVVGCYAAVELPVIDLERHPPPRRLHELERIRDEIARTHFDLERPPLFKLSLVRLAPESHELVVALHHYICDGWSLVRALREVASLYTGEKTAARVQSVIGPGSYPEYARRQRANCRTPAVAASLAAWRTRLEVFHDPIPFPRKASRAAGYEGSGARMTFAPDAELEHRVRALAASLRCTVATVLTGIFALTLGRMSGAGKFLIGMAASDRPHADFEETVGFFVNWLPLRVDLSGNPDFAAFLADMHRERMTAFADAHIPFDEIVHAVGCDRNADKHPLFQFMFVSHVPARGVRLGDLTAEINPLFSGASKLNLTMFFTDARQALPVAGSGGIHLEIEYAVRLFVKGDIDRFAHIFLETAKQVVADPLRKVGSSRFQATHPLVAMAPSANHSLSPLIDIASVIENTPDSPALSFQGGIWTYRRLGAFADRVARELARTGIRPGDRVCVLCARGPMAVAGMLGTMLSGAVFTPLDACNPDARLASIIEQAGPAAFLASDGLIARTRHLAGELPVLSLSQTNPEGSCFVWDQWLTKIESGSPAYLLFTSGSGGHPKGVLGGHSQLANFCGWLSRYLDLGGRDAVLGKTSFSFDASFRETVAPLVAGARLELAADREALDSSALLRIISTRGVTVLHTTPTLYRDLLLVLEQARREGLATDALAGLRCVMCGGESMDRELAAEHFRLLPERRLYNVYGPTECTVDVTAHEVHAEDAGPFHPIGRPIQNTSIAIVDHDLRPLGPGEEGEIVIAGQGVGLGYWDESRRAVSPARSRFMPAQELGMAIPGDAFLSGDYGVLRNDGVIEFRGRRDRQVQLGGVRIELDEIEAALLRVDDVVQAAAGYRRDFSPGYILAFVELKRGSPARDASIWRETLSQYLPVVMIPATVVAVDKLPRLVTGKIDREALWRMPMAQADEGELSMEAKVIVGLMQELLGRTDVSPCISFFAQGGHSLNAVRLVARANRRFSRALTIKDFFADPTALGFARRIISAPDSGTRELPMVQTPRPRRMSDG